MLSSRETALLVQDCSLLWYYRLVPDAQSGDGMLEHPATKTSCTTIHRIKLDSPLITLEVKYCVVPSKASHQSLTASDLNITHINAVSTHHGQPRVATGCHLLCDACRFHRPASCKRARSPAAMQHEHLASQPTFSIATQVQFDMRLRTGHNTPLVRLLAYGIPAWNEILFAHVLEDNGSEGP